LGRVGAETVSGIFLYADGRARELDLVTWLDLWAALPPAVSLAVEAGDVVSFMTVKIWRRL